MFTHWLHIYDKPAQGNGFIHRYTAHNYTHKINIMGWFDSASCTLGVNPAQAELIFENYVGNRCAVYVDNPNEPIWEGLITRISYSSGGMKFTRTIDTIANRVRVNVDNGSVAENAGANDLPSQAIYGIKVAIVKGKYASNMADELRDRKAAELALPQTSMSVGGGRNLLTLEMRGIYETLKWERARTSSGNRVPDLLIRTYILAVLDNGTTFFDADDYSLITVNGAIGTEQIVNLTGAMVWDALENLAETGDASNIWMVGISPTINNKRRLYYRASNQTLKYTARASDGYRIRNKYGKLIKPWRVEPDGIIRLQDVLVGFSAASGEDPRETYVKSITYKANTGRITWAGEDDITEDGVRGFFTSQKTFGRRFGQPLQKG